MVRERGGGGVGRVGVGLVFENMALVEGGTKDGEGETTTMNGTGTGTGEEGDISKVGTGTGSFVGFSGCVLLLDLLFLLASPLHSY
jgi:hypothetical protein